VPDPDPGDMVTMLHGVLEEALTHLFQQGICKDFKVFCFKAVLDIPDEYISTMSHYPRYAHQYNHSGPLKFD